MHLDHILIRVDSLDEAINDFEKAGFRVCPGRAGKKQYNALIYFKEGPYLELLAPSTFPWFLSFLHVTHLSFILGYFGARVAHFIGAKKRILDWAIGVGDARAYRAKLASKGDFSRVIAMSKVNCENDLVSWELFAPKCFELPFLISDYTPHVVPHPLFCEHPNGISSIQRLCYRWEEPHVKEMTLIAGETLSYENDRFRVAIGAYDVVLSSSHEGVFFDRTYAKALKPLSGYGILTE
ncbi:MAG TPA: hypothetical protein CFH80_06515 [Sulfurospirillum cavolei]|jgi:hypothetical protein|uniref:Glyoxalase-like domain-containing protein n=1 Tax=Sulfurospirillum cavolei TaxID=366522 RepID=A0A2D3W6T9_9BACT|nr:MAG TPA: hypothetical protein CFH80_06515 [Sulfurospirillum cavolei]